MWILQAGILAAAAISSSLFASFVLPASDGTGSESIIWDGGGDAVSWSDCRNWNADICPRSDSDVRLTSGTDVNLDSNFTFAASNLIIDSKASLNILPSVSLAGESHDSVLANAGTVIISAGARISWSGQITNSADGSINNKGIIESCGRTVNNGTINNKPDASFAINCASDFDNSGKLYNFGSFVNAAKSNTVNPGTFINAAHFDNQSTFQNGGFFRSNGTISNLAGSSFTSINCATFLNSGPIKGESIQFVTGTCSQ